MTISSASRSDDRAIGVFDSGVGGLSVLRAIRGELPSEDVSYVGDSANAPYGDKPAEFVRQRAAAISQFLIDQGVKAIVVACNTATGIAVEELRARFRVPIVAVEPAVKPAAARTRSGVVGVLATAGTLSSPNLSRLVNTHGVDVRFLVQACPGLADQVEQGEFRSRRTITLIEQYVRPLVAQGADVLVLGCTHYPFLKDAIAEVAGPEVELVDPAEAVARELHRRLGQSGLLAPAGRTGVQRFWTTGSPEHAARVISQLVGAPVTVAQATERV